MANILIIGGGVSGLSAGIYAQRNGHNATICEKHIMTGGNLTAWNRDGYPIDTCIHWLTGTNKNSPMYTMWEQLGALGGDVIIHKPDVLFTVEHDGLSLSLSRSLDETVENMLKLSPQDKKQIKCFKNAVEVVLGFLNTYGPEFDGKIAISEILKRTPAILKYFTHSTGELSKKFKHPLLKLFMTSLMGRDFCGVDFAFVAATFVSDNADVPEGLSKPMAERMTNRFLSLGGTLYTGKEATHIDFNNGHATSVTFKDGSTLTADKIILCIDPFIACNNLLNTDMPKELKKQFENKKYKYFSSYHIEYAVDVPFDSISFSESLFIEVPDDLITAVGNRRIILRHLKTEPDFSKENTANLQAMIYCNEEGIKEFLNLKASDISKYKELKQSKEKAVRMVIEERFPEFKSKMHVLDIWTPATFKRFTGSHMGTYQAFINPKFTMPKKTSGQIPGLDNVYLASQWQMAPGGLPAAASAGRQVIKTIDGYIK